MDTAVSQLVDHFWADITAVAKALLKYGKLTGRQIRAVIEEAQSKRRASRPHPLARYRALPWSQKFYLIMDGYKIERAAYQIALGLRAPSLSHREA